MARICITVGMAASSIKIAVCESSSIASLIRTKSLSSPSEDKRPVRSRHRSTPAWAATSQQIVEVCKSSRDPAERPVAFMQMINAFPSFLQRIFHREEFLLERRLRDRKNSLLGFIQKFFNAVFLAVSQFRDMI